MNLQPIGPENIDRAEAVLCRGFPDRPPDFWHNALGALTRYQSSARTAASGSLLSVCGTDVGVLLAIESPSRSRNGRAIRKVNLSSWYVDESARYLAAMMLKASIASPEIVYTDLTPTLAVRALNQRLGLVPIRIGSMIVPLPIDALRPDQANVTAFAETSLSDLDPDDARMLHDHAAMGLESAVLVDGGAATPLILMPTRFRGLRGARVLHAPSRGDLRRHRGSIARYLIKLGFLFLEVEAARSETWPSSLFAPTRAAVFAKGPIDLDGIDHSYSELAFLHSTT